MEWGERIDAMAAGYRNSCILVAAVKTGIFEALGDEERTAAEVAAHLDLNARAVDVVMCALAAAEVLLARGDRFAIDPGARPYLLADSPETLVSIIGHNKSMLKSWVQLEEVLRTGAPAPRAERTAEEMEDFIRGMENVSRRTSSEVADQVDLSGAVRLLDLGGGPGTAALTFARANSGLECVVYDLEGPLGIACQQIRQAGLEDRVTTRAGDFLVDDLPEGFDVVYISNIIHMLRPDETRMLLAKAHRALVPGGRILVKDFFLEDSRIAPPWTAQFSVNMLVNTKGGKSYTFTEMEDLLAQTGYIDLESFAVAANSRVIVGYRES
ncbi:MAG: methyltransferase [Candidatus Krumholzibacteriota bacterium]